MYFFISVGPLKYIYSPRGTPLVLLDNYLYRNNRGKYWRCFNFIKHRCKARLIIDQLGLVKKTGEHTHEQVHGRINFNRDFIKVSGNNATLKVKPKLKKKNRKTYQKKNQQVFIQQDELQIKNEISEIETEVKDIKKY